VRQKTDTIPIKSTLSIALRRSCVLLWVPCKDIYLSAV
jgi:hypothetical protein